MGRKASYPDWVSKYVKKGQYVNKINGSYYLYEAHSERREGISHPVRVCDGYVGRITQEDGLVPSKKRDHTKSENVSVPKPLPTAKPDAWVFGTHYAVITCSENILLDLEKDYMDQAPLIYVMSILTALYSESSQSLYEMSVLAFRFPNLSIVVPKDNPAFKGALERGPRMISDAIRRTYGDDWPLLQACLSASVIIRTTRGYKATEIQGYAPDLFRKYGLTLNIKTFEALKEGH
ncbi:MAG: hypothetical protein IJ088_15760 [Clostridia bacterium]|nr:hypothetical protein [Clostridia bacterium]